MRTTFGLLLMAFGCLACEGSLAEVGPSTTPRTGENSDEEEDREDNPLFVPGPSSDGTEGSEGEVIVSHGTVELGIRDLSSASVTVDWPRLEGVTDIEVQLGTEPPSSTGELAGPVQVHVLDSASTEFSFNDLAASSDAFIVVHFTMDDGSEEYGAVRVRTLGGPAAELATPLQSVDAAGRDVLRLVLVNRETYFNAGSGSYEGNQGAAWQSGTWRVTRHDGAEIDVQAVHRETRPVGQPDIPIGYEVYGDSNIVDLEHVIHLVLEEPLGNQDIFTIQHDGTPETELGFTLPFSDRYLETSAVQLNQLGYNPRATQRWAYVSTYMGDGGALSLDDIGEEAEMLIEPRDGLVPRTALGERLPIHVRADYDNTSGTPVGEIDLSSVPPAEGVRYRVYIPGVGVSFPTAISEEAVFRAFFTLARGMFHNRWCGDLSEEYTEWSRGEDHCKAYFVSGTPYEVFMFSESTPRIDERPVRGGHHDAGDFDIRPFHVVVGQYLMRAFELNQAQFVDGQLHVPESGNGIPDLLDEALWSLAAWEALQNEDGSVRAGVESHAHPRGTYPANEDQLPYWTFDPEPWHTAYVAALFAQASRLVAPFDEEKAATLEQRARDAYDSGIVGSAPASYRLYAASEMAALTGEDRYFEDFEARWSDLDRYGNGAFDRMEGMMQIYPGAFSGSTPAMADFVMGYARSDRADPEIVDTIHREMRSRADSAADAILESPHAHRNAQRPSDVPDWGRSTSTGRHVDFIYQALHLGGLPEDVKQRYINAMSVAADYALGANPMGMSYITGLGSRTPRQPLHLDSLVAISYGDAPVPGLPVFGPVHSLPSAYYYRPVDEAHYPMFDHRPVGRRFADSRTSVNTIEFTIWENQSPLTELFAAQLGSGLMPPASWLPGGAQHRATLPSF